MIRVDPSSLEVIQLQTEELAQRYLEEMEQLPIVPALSSMKAIPVDPVVEVTGRPLQAVIESGWADHEERTAWRAAELRRAGKKVEIRAVRWVKPGGASFILLHDNGQLENPDAPPPSWVSHSEQTISVTPCLNCGCVTLNQISEECGNCKGELYPVSKIIPPGSWLVERDRIVTPEGKKIEL